MENVHACGGIYAHQFMSQSEIFASIKVKFCAEGRRATNGSMILKHRFLIECGKKTLSYGWADWSTRFCSTVISEHKYLIRYRGNQLLCNEMPTRSAAQRAVVLATSCDYVPTLYSIVSQCLAVAVWRNVSDLRSRGLYSRVGAQRRNDCGQVSYTRLPRRRQSSLL